MNMSETARPFSAGVSALEQAWEAYAAGSLRRGESILERLIGGNVELPLRQRAEAFELLGLIKHDLGLPQEAADAIENAGLITPLRDSARVALAGCYAQMEHVDLAREMYLQLALSRTLSSSLMLEIAAGLEAIDSPALAMQVCELIMIQDDCLAQVYYDMGYYSARAGQPLYLTEALTLRALKLDPANIHYKIGLVSLLIQLKRDDEAIRVVGGMNPSDINQVTCLSCLEKIAVLLQQHEFGAMASTCRARVEQLRLGESLFEADSSISRSLVR